MPWITPWTFTPSTQLQSSPEVPTSGLKTCTPALLQSRRTSPNSSYARDASAATEAGSETSVRTAIASPPASRSSEATRSASSSWMSATTTRMPAS